MALLRTVVTDEPFTAVPTKDDWTALYRMAWMLRRIMDGGNFGQYAPQQQYGLWRRFFTARWQQVKMIRFDFWEVLWIEIRFWTRFLELIPARIRYRTLSLNNIER